LNSCSFLSDDRYDDDRDDDRNGDDDDPDDDRDDDDDHVHLELTYFLHITTFLRRCEAGSFCGQQNDLYAHICVYLYNITNMFWTDSDEINTNSRHEQRYSSRNSFRKNILLRAGTMRRFNEYILDERQPKLIRISTELWTGYNYRKLDELFGRPTIASPERRTTANCFRASEGVHRKLTYITYHLIFFYILSHL
jgi:hypothetical protein